MSAFTQHIGRSVSCQQFVQGHLVGTASLCCMTSENAEASSVVTKNKKPPVLRREMVNEIALFPDGANEIGFSDAAACSLPCDDEDAVFDSEGGGFDTATFTFQPPKECVVLTSGGFMYTTEQCSWGSFVWQCIPYSV